MILHTTVLARFHIVITRLHTQHVCGPAVNLAGFHTLRLPTRRRRIGSPKRLDLGRVTGRRWFVQVGPTKQERDLPLDLPEWPDAGISGSSIPLSYPVRSRVRLFATMPRSSVISLSSISKPALLSARRITSRTVVRSRTALIRTACCTYEGSLTVRLGSSARGRRSRSVFGPSTGWSTACWAVCWGD